MNPGFVLLVTVVIAISGLAVNDAYALPPNQSLILEGSGYLATEQTIQTSDVDIILETGAQSGSRTNVDIESGFVTIGNNDYMITDYTAMSLRDGKYIRISVTAESLDGDNEITISTLGRLIQDSQSGSIYTFTGRMMDGDTTYKIIYIGWLSGLSVDPTTTQEPVKEASIIVRINEGASNSALTSSYIDKTRNQVAGYFSVDRLTVTPGTSVTFVNDDTVQHTLVSGTGLASTSRVNSGGITICESEEEAQEGASYTKNNCDFTIDGRLNSGIIAPGKSWTATFDEMGFYRLIDTDYPWMNLVVYNFPQSDNQLIRQGNNVLGN